MSYVVRPLSDRTWLRPEFKRTPTRFSASWTETETLLLDEVDRLRGRDLVIEVDVREQDLRLDGRLRSNVRASAPAVVVAFETTAHGPLLYRCDTFTTSYYSQGPEWQHNVRAIAKTLEALRAVDRYGATETGQQYAGFKALPAGTAMPASHMTRTDAIEILTGDRPASDFAPSPEVLHGAWRRARAVAHPDRNGGSRAAWDKVEQAARVLGVAQ